MNRLASIGSNPTLRTYIQGAARQSISSFQEFIAPTVGVATMAGKIKEWGPKTGVIIPNTKRGLKGKATRVGFDASDKNYNLVPNALDYPVDEVELEDESLIALLQEGADITAQLAGLASHKETVDLALATLGAGTDVNTTTNGIDLVNEVDDAIRSVILGCKGFAPMMEIRILWSLDSWKTFKNHVSVRDRFKSGKKESSEITTENVASLFVTPVKQQVGTLVYDANVNEDAADMQFMLGDSVVIFAASANPTRMDTSFMKSLRLRGKYMSMRQYKTEDGRQEVAGFDWNEEIIVGNSSAGKRLNWTEA